MRGFFTVSKKDRSEKPQRQKIDVGEELEPCVEYYHNFIEDAADVYDKLLEELDLKQEKVILRGITYDQPRLSSVHAEDPSQVG